MNAIKSKRSFPWAVAILCLVVIAIILGGIVTRTGNHQSAANDAKDTIVPTIEEGAETILAEGVEPTPDTISKQTQLSEPTDTINGHAYVDLGLSVKWATCNVGASDPSDYGDYYAWGETKPKSEYIAETNVTYEKLLGCITGNPRYDVATANWGSDWRLPTRDEILELEEKCTCEWTKLGEINGYTVTGPNGNSIFLPAAGWYNGTSLYLDGMCGSYWSATPDREYAGSACYLYFCCDDALWAEFAPGWHSCYNGQSVRPVSGKKPSDAGSDISTMNRLVRLSKPTGTINGHQYVDLGLSVKWATSNVGASSPSDYGNYYAWGETKPKSEYTEENSLVYGRDDIVNESIAGNPKYDAATANWGGTWRLPTEDELRELEEKCSWKWTTVGGHNGYKVTGPNGKSIFLPSGYIWGAEPWCGNGNVVVFIVGATPCSDGDFPYLSVTGFFGLSGAVCYEKHLVRPVSE